jgi:hypothetical protein
MYIPPAYTIPRIYYIPYIYVPHILILRSLCPDRRCGPGCAHKARVHPEGGVRPENGARCQACHLSRRLNKKFLHFFLLTWCVSFDVESWAVSNLNIYIYCLPDLIWIYIYCLPDRPQSIYSTRDLRTEDGDLAHTHTYIYTYTWA